MLVGISNEDTKEVADKMIKKLIGMRIFSDEEGKINLDLAKVNGELLVVSQFTLYADCKRVTALPLLMLVHRIWQMSFMNT